MDKLLCASKQHKECSAILSQLRESRKQLPVLLQRLFDSAFGIDKQLDIFLFNGFGVDLLDHPQKEKFLAEAMSGQLTESNPINAISRDIDVSLLLDQIDAYAEASKLIRSVLGIELDVLQSESEFLADQEFSLSPETFYIDIFDDSGQSLPDMLLKVEMFKPVSCLSKSTSVFTNSSMTDIYDILISVFKGDEVIGHVSGTTVTLDKSAIRSSGGKSIPTRYRNAAFTINAQDHSEALGQAINNIRQVAIAKSSRNGQDSTVSLASEFMLPRPNRDRRHAVMAIDAVDLKEQDRGLLENIVESFRYLMEDPAQQHVDTYARFCKGYDKKMWSIWHDSSEVQAAYLQVDSRLCLHGISVITPTVSNTWWSTQLVNYEPTMSDYIVETRIVAPVSIVETKMNSKSSFSLDIESALQSEINKETVNQFH